jgi:hypothetical protein
MAISGLDESEGVRGGTTKSVGVLIDGERHRCARRDDHARGRVLPWPVRARQA